MVDVAQGFQLFTTCEVSDGIDLEMTLADFKAKAVEGKKHASAGGVSILYNGKKLSGDDRTLKKCGVKDGVKKLTVTNLGAVPLEQIGLALRSLGFAPTETQMTEFKEECGAAGMTLAQAQKFIADMEAEPIGQQAIDDMKEVLAKEGYFKAASVRKIFSLLEAEDITPDELEKLMATADSAGNGQIPTDFFQQMI